MTKERKTNKKLFIFLIFAILISLAILLTTFLLLRGNVKVVNPNINRDEFLTQDGDVYHLVVDDHYLENIDRQGSLSFVDSRRSKLLHTSINDKPLVDKTSPTFDDIFASINEDKKVNLELTYSRTFRNEQKLKIQLDFENYLFAFVDGKIVSRQYVGNDNSLIKSFYSAQLSKYNDYEWFYNKDLSGEKVELDSVNIKKSNIYASSVKVNKVRHKVILDVNGGRLSDTTNRENQVEEGQLFNEPAVPSKKGYIFQGWTLEGRTYEFLKPIEKEITLKATWELEKYYITFANIDRDPIEYDYETPDFKINDPVKVGFDFQYWTTDGTDILKDLEIKAHTVGNIELKAQFSPKEYTISYKYFYTDIDGSQKEYTLKKLNDTDDEQTKVLYLENYYLTNIDPKFVSSTNSEGIPIGYVFDNYYSKLDDGSYVLTPKAGIYEKIEDIVIYKKYVSNNYTVTFNLNADGEETEPNVIDPIQKPKETDLELPKAPKRAGYKFIGWFKDNYLVQDPYNGANDVTLTARWEKEIYTVTFNPKGGIWIVNDFSIVERDNENEPVYEVKRYYKQEIQTKPATTREDYKFEGWYTTDINKDKTETKLFENNKGLVVTSNLYIYAKWVPKKYIITYEYENDNNGTIETKDINESYTDGFKLFKPNNTYNGKRFLGWYIEGKDKGKIITDSDLSSIPFNEKVILKAKWGDNIYIVNFNTFGGSKIADRFIEYGEKILDPIITQKIGKELKGWYFDKDYINEVDFDTFEVTEDVSLYAKWDNITYNIEYELNDGQLSTSNPDTYNFDTKTILNHPHKDGYDFTGWTIDGVTTIPNPLFNIYKGNVGNIKLIASFKPHIYNVTFLYGSIDTSDNKQSTIGVRYLDELELPNSNKEGYEFLGWYYQGTDKKRDNKERFEEIENVVLVARYELKKFQVLFLDEDGNKIGEEKVTNNDIILDDKYRSLAEKEGYSFSTWSVSQYANDVKFPQTITSDRVYTAILKPKTYRIRYYLNLTSYEEQEVLYRSVFNPKQYAQINGYKILGWYTYDPVTKQFPQDSEQLQKFYNYSKDVYVKLKIEKNNYVVAYDPMGGYFVDENGQVIDNPDFTRTYSYNEYIEKLPIVKKDGWEFAGWKANSNTISTPYPVKYDMVIQASWTQNTFKYTRINLIRQTISSSNYIKYNSFLYLAPESDTDQYVFDYWYYIENDKEIRYDTQPYKFTRNMTFYAKYKKRKYIIKFVGPRKNKDPKENKLFDFVVYNSQNVYEYEEKIVPPTPAPVNGHEFLGWAKRVDYSVDFNKGSNFEQANLEVFPKVATINSVFYAIYKPRMWRLVYHWMTNEGEKTNVTSVNDGQIVFWKNDFSSEKARDFLGWTLEDKPDAEILPGSMIYNFGKDIDLYAKWDYKEAKVSFDGSYRWIDPREYRKSEDYKKQPNYKELKYDDVENKTYLISENYRYYPAGVEINPEDLPYPFSKSSKAVGYFKNSILYDFEKDPLILYSDYRFDVKFKTQEYKVTYHYNDQDKNSTGQETIFERTVLYGTDNSSYNISIRADGYTFLGWYLDEKFEKRVSSSSFDYNKNIDLYAKWQLTNYSISYDGVSNSTYFNYYNYGGTNYSYSKYSLGEIKTLPKTFTENDEIDFTIPERQIYSNGRIFTGWVDYNTREKVDKIERGTTKSVKLLATWQNKDYYINIIYYNFVENKEFVYSKVINDYDTLRSESSTSNIYTERNKQIYAYKTDKDASPTQSEYYILYNGNFRYDTFAELINQGYGTQDKPLVFRPVYNLRDERTAEKILIPLYKSDTDTATYEYKKRVKDPATGEILWHGHYFNAEELYNNRVHGTYIDGMMIYYTDGSSKFVKAGLFYEVGQEEDQNGVQKTESEVKIIRKGFDYKLTVHGLEGFTLYYNNTLIKPSSDTFETNINYFDSRNEIKDANKDGYDFLGFSSNPESTSGSKKLYWDNPNNDIEYYAIFRKKRLRVTYSYTINREQSSSATFVTYGDPYQLWSNENNDTNIQGFEVESLIGDIENPTPISGKSKFYYEIGQKFDEFNFTKDLNIQVTLKPFVFGVRLHLEGATLNYLSTYRNGDAIPSVKATKEELLKDPTIEQEKIQWLLTDVLYNLPFSYPIKKGYKTENYYVRDKEGNKIIISRFNDEYVRNKWLETSTFEEHDVPNNAYIRNNNANVDLGVTRKIVRVIDIFLEHVPTPPTIYFVDRVTETGSFSGISFPKGNYVSNVLTAFNNVYYYPTAAFPNSTLVGWVSKQNITEEPKMKAFIGERQDNPDVDNLDDYHYITENTTLSAVFRKNYVKYYVMDENYENFVGADGAPIEFSDFSNINEQIKPNQDELDKKVAMFDTNYSDPLKYKINYNGYTSYYMYFSDNSEKYYNYTIDFAVVDNDIEVVKSRYNPITYSIKYLPSDENSSYNNSNASEYRVLYDLTLIPAELDGYDFVGWKLEKTEDSNISVDDYPNPEYAFVIKKGTIGTLSFKPIFKVKTSKITYHLGYEDINNPNSDKSKVIQIVEAKDRNHVAYQPERRGYRFANWTTRNGNYSSTFGTSGLLDEDVNAIARWYNYTYNISYDLSGAINVNNPTQYDVNSSFKLTAPIKKGSIFKGWVSSYHEGNKTDGDIPNIDFEFRPYDESKPYDAIENKYSRVGDITLKAIFEDIKYNVTFDLNYTGSQPQTIKLKYKDTYSLLNIDRPGYRLVNWSEKSRTYSPGTRLTLETLYDLEYVANWESSMYTITFEDGVDINFEKEYNHQANEFRYGDYIREPKLINTNYEISRWFKKDQPDVSISFPLFVTENVQIAFEKRYKEYSIVYDLDGGINSEFNPDKYSLGQPNATNIRIEKPTKYGYIFKGWTYANDQSLNRNLSINAEIVKGPILLEAHWEAIFNKVTFDTLYLENKYIYQDVPFDQNVQKPQDPEPLGYKFIYWFEDDPFVPFDFTKPIKKSKVNLKAYYHRYEKLDKIIYTKTKPNEVAILFNRYVPYLENTIYSKDIFNKIQDKIKVINGRKPINIYGQNNNKLVFEFEPNAINENMIITLEKDLPIFSNQNQQIGLLDDDVRIAYYHQRFVKYVKSTSFTVEISNEVVNGIDEKVIFVTIKPANATVTPIFKFATLDDRKKVEIILIDSIKQLNQFKYIIRKKVPTTTPENIQFTVEVPELSQIETIDVSL